ncbi:MBL fold metallo-hydrolase [Deinococcus hopiensis]|uniref:Metal-dependent hydrolases of the beta-lactamase superfamily III n=1 Tax=Deinococcus hopiensis KR-140 TaxID=695939 RepID=A0A1W1VFQ4_9DEIO|nr:MBL fold metallo-hydrolase [Deinococcus hopiensis]SMB92043.1 Metal-dependent hydrolases of the beta-lactamase superfamily III [Deinococcus hopiensis KR-140]
MSAAIRVLPLTAGQCLGLAALTGRGAPWRVERYPAGFALILHPLHGPVLFDTGYAPRVLSAMSRWPGLLYGLVTPVQIDVRETAAAQLARLGFPPAGVRQIIVSHLHADHVGGLRDFPGATFVLDLEPSRSLLAQRGLRALRRAFLPELLPPDFLARVRPLTFAPAPSGLAPFSEAADVFGDGSVYAVRVPGHAPGMIALIARTQPGAALEGDGAGLSLLAADVAWRVPALRSGGEPHPLARLAFGDPVGERRSRAGVRAWLEVHPHARVILSHDLPEAGPEPVHVR